MAFVLGLTCSLLYAQLRPEEKDISQAIRRKLGPAFGISFAILSAIAVFFVSSIFFLLAADLLYVMFVQIFGNSSIYSGPNTGFPQLAFQMILLVLFGALNYLPDLTYVFKAAPFALGCLICSVLTMIVSIPFNSDNINSSFLTPKPITA